VKKSPGSYDIAPFRDKLTIHSTHPAARQRGFTPIPRGANGDNFPQDWMDFVTGVIERSRETR
jgi:hypothetical protein